MSIFSELLPKINEITNSFTKNYDDDLKVAFDCFDKFDEEHEKSRSRAREKTQKDKNVTTLQSINEDETVTVKQPEMKTKRRSGNSSSNSQSSESGNEQIRSKKRSKNEVEGMSSPEVDKRQKRNASVKAQGIISKQVNVNLTQKMRRETSNEKIDKNQSTRGKRQKEDEKENVVPNNLPVLQIKVEKLSIPPEAEPMDTEPLPIDIEVKEEPNKDDIAMPPPTAPIPKPRKILPKEKPSEDASEEESQGRRRTTRTRKQTDSMVPPTVPVERPVRASSRARQPEPEEPQPTSEGRPKRTRAKKKQNETNTVDVESDTTQSSQDVPVSPTVVPRPKRTRRGQKAIENEQPKPVEPDPTQISPKEERISEIASTSPILQPNYNLTSLRLRGKKDKTNLVQDLEEEKDLTKTNRTEKDSTKINMTEKELAQTKNGEIELVKANSTETESTKTRNKEDSSKTKHGEKEKESVKTNSYEQPKTKGSDKVLTKTKSDEKMLVKPKSQEKELAKIENQDKELAKTRKGGKELVKTKSEEKESAESIDVMDNKVLDETRIITKPGEMDQTVVLPNGVYNHAPITPQNVRNMNETVLIPKINRETMVINKPQNVMNATVVLEKDPRIAVMTEDNSLLTDDSDHESGDNYTPPQKQMQTNQPTSAVKEKVQQFEELATRVTRTKTRAMAKKDDEPESLTTPPDKISKAVISADTLTKMNSLIFNGKPPGGQVSSSAAKPRTNVIPTKPQPSSTSKLSAINKAKEAAEETLRREDARKKKEALLEAKREQQKRKREEKMAAAAAAREAAEKERRLAMEAAAKERMEKQAHADLGKIERLKEAERKKQELARKAAETEERRKAEETARQQRLAEEQRKAMAQRRKQQEEQEAMKREAAIMAKEIEQKQREYNEKQKKHRLEDKTHTPFKTPGTPSSRYPVAAMEPVYMLDGFQYLNSDEEEDPPERPIPEWSTSRSRKQALLTQSRIAAVHIDRLFSVRVHSPDLRDIFPNIERARLKRTSSAVWRTPPHLPTLSE